MEARMRVENTKDFMVFSLFRGFSPLRPNQPFVKRAAIVNPPIGGRIITLVITGKPAS
jgi:hypothetical protein